MREYVGDALRNAGYPYELLVTDNGSVDQRTIDWVKEQNPKLFFINKENKGTTQSLNRMIDANESDYYVFIGNDIRLPENWLRKLVEYGEAIPDSGVVGINWRPVEYPEKIINGKKVWEASSIFGTMFISGKLRKAIGRFCEDYGVYGLWDGDYSYRAKGAGFLNYYLAGEVSEHKGNDVGEDSEYRRMKDKSLAIAKPIFDNNIKRYAATGNYYIA